MRVDSVKPVDLIPDGDGGYLWNPDEPPFSDVELEHAADLLARSDKKRRCPHQPECDNAVLCIENVAWFIRHWRQMPDILESDGR